jgi:hypothetical protein
MAINNKAKIFKSLLIICLLWILINFFLVIFSWSKSYFVDFGPSPSTYEIDIRKNTNQSGHIIKFVATQPNPKKGWLFGHLWVAFDTTPNNEEANTFQFGYYAKNKALAAKELAIAVFNPFGFYFGQKSTIGQIQSDDKWKHQLELVVKIDDASYQNALLTHYKWRAENRYINRPAWGKESFACQDYAFAIANSIGLKSYKNHYGEFPPESFVHLAKVNGIKVKKRPKI